MVLLFQIEFIYIDVKNNDWHHQSLKYKSAISIKMPKKKNSTELINGSNIEHKFKFCKIYLTSLTHNHHSKEMTSDDMLISWSRVNCKLCFFFSQIFAIIGLDNMMVKNKLPPIDPIN
jgi:hypothetical protein